MAEALMLSGILVGVLMIYVATINNWAREKAETDRAYEEGFFAGAQIYDSLNGDAEHKQVSDFLKRAVITQAEIEGRLIRGDKKKIRLCVSRFEIEEIVHQILMRKR